jgi:hypothetical protein
VIFPGIFWFCDFDDIEFSFQSILTIVVFLSNEVQRKNN